MTFAAIDAGTTGVRCMIVGENGEVLSVSRRTWEYSTPADLEIAKEFNPAEFWDLIRTVVREALKASKLTPSQLKAVSTTSQRHGMVLLDKDDNELHGGPNIDARGAMTQYVIEESVGERYLEITGCWPPMMYAPSRVAWFEEDEPEIFESIGHLLPLSDWITFKLSGEYVTDLAQASSTGFFDIQKIQWNQEIADAVGIDISVLPEIKYAGEVIGNVTSLAEKETSLPEGLPVVMGSTDTHCAMLASQTIKGEISIIAGSTTPILLVVDKPICASEEGLWTSCHISKNLWTIESNATLTGAYIDWIVSLLCERSENPEMCKKRTYDKFDEILQSVPVGSNETIAALGPNIMNSKRITDIPLARMFFPQPALPQVVPLSSAAIIRAVVENIAYSVRGNCEQLEEFSEVSKVKTIGGISRSEAWVDILSNVMNRPIERPIQYEGSLLGAAICAATGAGIYQSIESAAEAMVKWYPTHEPNDTAKGYEFYYKKWKEIWTSG